MRSLNRVFIIGHLGAQPQLKVSKNGRPYTRLSVATNKQWTSGEQREQRTDWHSVFVWGALAEICVKHARKGALLFVEGGLSNWKVAQQIEEGTKYHNAIQATEVKFLNGIGDYRRLESSMAEDLDNGAATGNHDAVAHPA